MIQNCAMLTFRGFYTISPKEFTFCPEREAYMLRYQETPGVALHHIPQSRRHPTAIILGSWLAQLHNEGIRLGDIRESNIQLLPNGSPILLNPRNCQFYDNSIKEKYRKKDIKAFINAIAFIDQDQTGQQLFHEQYDLNRLNQVETEQVNAPNNDPKNDLN
jgi:KDO2-lipid IV(A) lauroyltransferase